MKLIPLADRVVVKLVEAEEKTKTGIIRSKPVTRIFIYFLLKL